ncbi:UNVERIFIED_ORG: hypothetical protein GGE64_006250 [Rhizobium etli]|uniref:hypothetical protein n=1 Tax=Rhizobium leguminosarum TaxID=384 RepID=UPI00140F7399|nr:hypothetical protein [Rhizobium leguminosarum]MBB4420856.1 hypothetical protein [Rhizobium leguminosarum]
MLEASKELTKAAVAVTVGMRPTILLPQDEQSHAGLLEFDGKIGPIGFDTASRALFDAVASEELVLERIVSEFARQRPAQSNCCRALLLCGFVTKVHDPFELSVSPGTNLVPTPNTPLIRTVQRRMKIWRSTQANALVFGPFADAARQTESIEVGQ